MLSYLSLALLISPAVQGLLLEPNEIKVCTASHNSGEVATSENSHLNMQSKNFSIFS